MGQVPQFRNIVRIGCREPAQSPVRGLTTQRKQSVPRASRPPSSSRSASLPRAGGTPAVHHPLCGATWQVALQCSGATWQVALRCSGATRRVARRFNGSPYICEGVTGCLSTITITTLARKRQFSPEWFMFRPEWFVFQPDWFVFRPVWRQFAPVRNSLPRLLRSCMKAREKKARGAKGQGWPTHRSGCGGTQS